MPEKSRGTAQAFGEIHQKIGRSTPLKLTALMACIEGEWKQTSRFIEAG